MTDLKVTDPKTRPTPSAVRARILVTAVALLGALFVLAVARQQGMLASLPPPLGDPRGREAALSAPPLTDAEAREAVRREAGHIAACSFTSGGADPKADGYGALNDDAVTGHGPDWVVAEPGAVGAISLLRAAAFLRAHGGGDAALEPALDGFFDVWLVGHRQGWVVDPHAAGFGGMSARLGYDGSGHRVRADEATPAATGMMLVAMWKRYEYLRDTGRAPAGRAWLARAWAVAEPARDYLLARFDTDTELEHGPASSPDEWLTDAVAARDALLCLDRWAALIGRPDPPCAATADRLRAGIAAMKEDDSWKGYYRLREHDQKDQPTNGDCVDQIAFLPYEADALDPGDPFVRQVSDGWTVGPNAMTAQAADPRGWTYFGTHWHRYFTPRLENDYLYPGPGLQLAKAEWKYARQAHDPVLALRAANRLRWAVAPQYSGLWDKSGGLVDWCDARDRGHSAEGWARFIDTSGYLIQAVLMVSFGQDTRYTPEDAPPASAVTAPPSTTSMVTR